VALRRDLGFLQTFLYKIASENVSREANELTEEALCYFAWNRTSKDIPPFMQTLKRDGWESWALLIKDECAIRRKPHRLAELLQDLDSDEQLDMLDTIAQSRRASDIPPLLLHMEREGVSQLVEPLLKRVSEFRESKYSSVLEAWQLAKR
ncbi:hypothetical protein J7E95_40860, partial [Streptomyces sp. ISL-14]|nr:hypothetical protein [Streptomyces sp. ISL-14]